MMLFPLILRSRSISSHNLKANVTNYKKVEAEVAQEKFHLDSFSKARNRPEDLQHALWNPHHK